VVAAVLDAPMPAHEAAEARRVGPHLAGVVRDLLAPPPQAGGGIPEPSPAGDPGDGGDVAPPARREVGGRRREDLDPALLVTAPAVAIDRLVPVERRVPGAQGDEGVMQARLVGLDPGEQGVAGRSGDGEGFFGSSAGHRP
jgi:hypothetical protein